MLYRLYQSKGLNGFSKRIEGCFDQRRLAILFVPDTDLRLGKDAEIRVHGLEIDGLRGGYIPCKRAYHGLKRKRNRLEPFQNPANVDSREHPHSSRFDIALDARDLACKEDVRVLPHLKGRIEQFSVTL